MTKFRLKISSNNIEVYQDKDKIGEGDDYKEILAFVAYTIDDEDIDQYEVWLHEKGNSEQLEDFDHETVLKYSKKLKFNTNNNDDDDDDDNRNNRRSSDLSRENSPSRQRYIPKYKPEDYKNIGSEWKISMNNAMGIE